jgi:hypothetical protein
MVFVDPIVGVGLIAAALQILQQLNQLKIRILSKPKDGKTLRAIRDEAYGHIECLKTWEDELGGDMKLVCRQLQEVLEEILNEIDDLKKRNVTVKVLTCLRIYSPLFQQRITHAISLFHVKLSVEGQKQAKQQMDMVTKQMEELQITKNQLQRISGTEDVLTKVDSEIRKLERTIEEIKFGQAQMQESLELFFPTMVTQITEQVKTDGNETRELMRSLITERTYFDNPSHLRS